ncbi:MAG: Crp/Fnr family transcriptional regulator [Rhizobiales bacterium]|nr:Crp/Fnr family transcriptional regulator [Hyphomicrobiales bacterium]OJY43678.1 MAG: Crp/Fnr family transcriptional regulator [Rhizobiales bacterium 64-17]
MHVVLRQKLQAHSALDADDAAALNRLPYHDRHLANGEDAICQGERPDSAILVLEGMVARYQTLADGRRQFISFHITGELPDAQALFLTEMDHSICALGPAVIAMIPHEALLTLFMRRPGVGLAIWRETLIDAAIFRSTIVNNSARAPLARAAHFFCEQYYRARSRFSRRGEVGTCSLPLSQAQLGDTLGMSIVTVNRTVQQLRRTGTMDWNDGVLQVKNWAKLAVLGEFDPAYLHARAPRRL